MARRRKKSKQSRSAAAAAAASTTSGNNPIVLDKSLPALPPSAVSQSALRGPVETPPSDHNLDTVCEYSPRSRPTHISRDGRDEGSRRDVSPMSDISPQGELLPPRSFPLPSLASSGDSRLTDRAEPLTLPASTYKQDRASIVSSIMVSDNDDDQGGFLPMAFDPNPAPGPPPSAERNLQHRDGRETTPRMKDTLSPKDYFGKRSSTVDPRDRLSTGERPSSSRSVSTERESLGGSRSSPHIAHQDRSRWQRKRDVSGQSTPVSGSNVPSPAIPFRPSSDRPERPRTSQATTAPTTEPFKLQEVPKDRKASRTNSRPEDRPPPDTLEMLGQTRYQPPSESNLPSSPISLDTPSSSFNPFDDPKLHDAHHTPVAALSAKIPARGDSLPDGARRDREGGSRITSPDTTPAMSLDPKHQRNQSATSAQYVDASMHIGHESGRSNPPVLDSPLRSAGTDAPAAPPRSAGRISRPSKSVGDNDDFIAPRNPPAPPQLAERPRNESVSTAYSDVDRPMLSQTSPAYRTLPKHNIGSEFSMEEEMARILRGEEREKRERQRENDSASVLRRVSNAVKHGRSFSDKSVGIHHKTPTVGSMEISSPIAIGSPISSPSLKDEMASLKAQLRRAQGRIAELEADKVGLEEQVNSSADIKQVNTELREKRSTMAFLDTQREMVVRELEIMTEHLSKAKDTNQPLDIQLLKSDILQDFARSLQKLKDSIGGQIEDLVHKRNELTDDISSLIQVKDKGLQEFESLSQKNQQLAELNNQLVTGIQDMYKANAGRLPNGSDRSPMANGLGIYTASGRNDSDLHSLKAGSLPESSSLSNLLSDTVDAEPATILTAPKVVDIRKAQPKKFWKKGSGGLGKSVTKGLKGAFAGGTDRPGNAKDGSYDLNGMPYSQMQAGPGAYMGEARQDGKAGFGFFSSGQKNGLKPSTPSGGIKNGSSTNLPAENATGMLTVPFNLQSLSANLPRVLFGSDLSERCEFEKRMIPSIVMHCIDEVELRGMDMEGIYRKSGGSGQVKIIQQGFDKDSDYDISDPDLDIHAVTSALKQYFRKLPNPLITYEAYDGVLHAAQITDREKQALTMRAALDALPQSHRDVLEYLVRHLCRVVKMESENLVCYIAPIPLKILADAKCR